MQRKLIKCFTSPSIDEPATLIVFKREKYGDVKDRGRQRGGSTGRIGGGWGTGRGRKDF